MAHEHPVVDADKRFLIDPITRIVKNAESKKTVLVQNDHNSERLSFELDRYVEGHDMLESTSVHIHYDNVGANRLKNSGVYEVDDIQPSPDDSTKVVFTWLVSQHATSLVGALNFSITFECDADGVVEYRWSTILNTSDVQISEGLDNGEVVANTYADILTKWKNELYSIIYTNPTFAEVCRWEDDNVDDEYRIGYFVAVEPSDITEESLIVKATAASTIRGVTMESPGFAANENDYKFDENGKLLPQYEYVGFSGFIPVIDNGTCSVNGWCKPGDKGTAEPTNDTSGYRVIDRVDENHVLILVEPQGAISTLIAKDTEIVEALAEHMRDTSNSHKVTAAQIGAAKESEHRWKVYYNLSDIGFTNGSETLAGILAAMPNYSVLRYIVTSGHNSSIYPHPYGFVEFKKASSTYADITFWNTSGSNMGTWEAYGFGSNNVWTVSDWYKDYNELNPPAVADMGISNPNLLHNWYFGNPVNRNNITSAVTTNSTDVMTIDRWVIFGYVNSNGAGITVNDGYITLKGINGNAYGGFKQRIDGALDNETFIFSALVRGIANKQARLRFTDGNNASTVLHQQAFTLTGDWQIISMRGTFTTIESYLAIIYPDQTTEGNSLDVLAAKLELGDQQTLAHQDANGNWVLNEIPDYAEQMAICMQYDATTGAYTGIRAADVGAFPTDAGSGVINGTTTPPFHIPPGHYSVNPGISTAYNWPADDTTNLNGTLLVFGRRNQPSTNKGYRVYVYFDNKDRFYYACEWWGNTPKWKEVFTTAGGTLSGDLKLDSGSAIMSANTQVLSMGIYSNDTNKYLRRLQLFDSTTNTNVVEALKLNSNESGIGKWYTIYGSHNITAGTTDITAGSSSLATDCYYDVYK